MRLPFGSETDAFRFACALGGAAGIAMLVGHLAGGATGVVLFALVGLGALVWTSTDPKRMSDSSPLLEAQRAGHELGGTDRRALIVANEALTGDSLWDEVLGHRETAPAVEVLAPVLQSRTHFVTTDIDEEVKDARRRLEDTLRAAQVHGLDATGRVGDPIDPFAAVADELRRYDVDEVIVMTHRPDRANWVESDLLERMRAQLDVPLAHVVIDRDADGLEVEWQGAG